MLRPITIVLLPVALASVFLFANTLRAAAAPPDPLAFTSQGSLNLTSGMLTFDTDTLQVSGGGAGVTNTMGSLYAQGGGNPDAAVFTFGDVLVGSGVTIQITGSRPVAILSHSNLQIDADLNISGNDGVDGAAHGSPNAPNGSNGQNGAQGSVGGQGAPAPVAAEPGGKGGNGGFNNANGQMGSPGNGGASGGNSGIATGAAFSVSGTGGNGNSGAKGSQGPGGTGGTGANSGVMFAIVHGGGGNSGANGISGKGGGGGGGGGGGSCMIGPFCTANSDVGGGGGSGGAGGLGGNQGQGGACGLAIALGAVGTVEMNGLVVGTGGDGGDGAAGQFGGIGGNGGSGFDDSGPGGKGGNGGSGGTGGPGGGGAGGTVYLFGAAIHSSPSLVDLSGGTFGTNPSGAVGMGGGSGLFRFEGELVLEVDSMSVFDQIDIAGRIDPSGAIQFDFASEGIADVFASAFTLDSFFVQNGAPVPDVTPFSLLTYSATSPTRTFDVTLNSDRSFTLTAVVPEPATLGLLAIGAAMIAGGARRTRKEYERRRGALGSHRTCGM